MKRNTRQEILDTAKQLFNKRGFNAVSIGEIAEALAMSKGNLTYHFQKKENIIEALLDENTAHQPPESIQTLGELDGYFLDMEQVVRENAFYFWHHAQLSQLSTKIREKQANAYQVANRRLMQAFHTLRKSGLLRAESFAGEYGNLADALLLACIYWMPFNAIKQSYGTQRSYPHHAWAILYHYLTDTGIRTAAPYMKHQ